MGAPGEYLQKIFVAGAGESAEQFCFLRGAAVREGTRLLAREKLIVAGLGKHMELEIDRRCRGGPAPRAR